MASVLDESEHDHYFTMLTSGSPHASDEEWVEPPAYETSEEEDVKMDNTIFANPSRDRLQRTVNDWCSCGSCVMMSTEEECVCCQESYIIQPHRGSESCITNVGLFKELVLNKDGLIYSRFLYSLTIEDEQRRARYMKMELNAPKLRFLAYKSFINIISSTEMFDMYYQHVLSVLLGRHFLIPRVFPMSYLITYYSLSFCQN